MANKDFTKAIETPQSVIDAIATGHTDGTQDTQGTKRTKKTKRTQDTQETQNTPTAIRKAKELEQGYYRFNLKIPVEYRDFIRRKAYEQSNPTHTVTITEYINELIKKAIEADEKKAKRANKKG